MFNSKSLPWPVSILIGVLLLLCGYRLGLLSSTAFPNYKQPIQVTIKTSQSSLGSVLPAGSPAHSREAPASDVVQPTAGNSLHLAINSKSSAAKPSYIAAQNTSAACQTPKPQTAVQQNSKGLISHAELDHVGVEGSTACEKGPSKGLKLDVSAELVAPVVILGHNRVNYLARCMMGLLKHWSKDPANAIRFPLFVSIDGGDQRSLNFAAAWKETAGVQVISRTQGSTTCTNGDCHLTGHFKMLMQLFFQCLQTPRVIFIEEDLEVAPDFLNYFAATAPLLSQDPSLWCISAWNDHGQQGRALNSTALYRTDIIPGLGWMINREQALPLIEKWPTLYWDDWMREPEIRQGRQCIYPEVPRTYHFGKVGTHMFGGSFFDTYLANIRLNSEDVEWSKQNLTYLLKEPYSALMKEWLSQAVPYDNTQLGGLSTYCGLQMPIDANNTMDLVTTYTWDETNPKASGFFALARQLPGVMDDLKGKRPRASYDGVVVVRCRGRRLFLRPA